MAKVDDVLKDPDFWHKDTTDDDRLFALENNDPKFKILGRERQTEWLKGRRKTYDENSAREQKEQQGRAQEFTPKAQEQQTIYQRIVAPLTEYVGQGIEAATAPLVPLARMGQGESAKAAFSPRGMAESVGHGGVAGQTRTNVGAAVVPQSPWQAGAMAAQAIPGVGALSAPLRVGASAAGAGGLQALLGEKGAVEGGGISDVAKEGVVGALKGGVTQAAGEVFGKAVGAGRRHQPGAGTLKANSDAGRVNRAAGEISPEFRGDRTAQEAGAFYQGTQGAQKAAEGQFGRKIQAIPDRQLSTPLLRDAYDKIVSQFKNEPMLADEIAKLAPNAQSGTWTADQVARIVSLTGKRLSGGDGTLGHMKNKAMDALVAEVERMGGKGLGAARDGYARSMGLKDVLSKMFDPGKGGFRMDSNKLQELLSSSPDLIDQIGPSGLEKLFLAATRGASKGPGLADQPAKGASSLYMPRSLTNIALKGMEKLLGRSHKVGEKPMTMSQGFKQKSGVATTAITSSNNPNERRD